MLIRLGPVVPLPTSPDTMVIFSVIAVLLLEQLRPLSYVACVRTPLFGLADWIERRFDAGESHNGAWAWCAVVVPLVALSGLVAVVFDALNPLLGWLWTVGVLYLTLGFRQFSHYYSAIHLALRMDDLEHARELLGEWRGESCAGLSASEVAQRAIEQALVASHRHVFGVLVCFVLLPGPCGAVLYCVAAELDAVWGRRSQDPNDAFAAFARQTSETLRAFVDSVVANSKLGMELVEMTLGK